MASQGLVYNVITQWYYRNRHTQGLDPLPGKVKNHADGKAAGGREASYLITLPPVGDVGTQLLVTYDLAHFLNGRVRGH